MRQTIVIVWTDLSGMQPTGRYVWRDANEFPEFAPCRVAKACVWLCNGSEYDVNKAHGYVENMRKDYPDITVKVYPTSERDPLGRAKAEMLASKEE